MKIKSTLFALRAAMAAVLVLLASVVAGTTPGETRALSIKPSLDVTAASPVVQVGRRHYRRYRHRYVRRHVPRYYGYYRPRHYAYSYGYGYDYGYDRPYRRHYSVAAPFARVHRDYGGLYVRAPFVRLHVPY